jgi:hypothetical protein
MENYEYYGDDFDDDGGARRPSPELERTGSSSEENDIFSDVGFDRGRGPDGVHNSLVI